MIGSRGFIAISLLILLLIISMAVFGYLQSIRLAVKAQQNQIATITLGQASQAGLRYLELFLQGISVSPPKLGVTLNTSWDAIDDQNCYHNFHLQSQAKYHHAVRCMQETFAIRHSEKTCQSQPPWKRLNWRLGCGD